MVFKSFVLNEPVKMIVDKKNVANSSYVCDNIDNITSITVVMPEVFMTNSTNTRDHQRMLKTRPSYR